MNRIRSIYSFLLFTFLSFNLCSCINEPVDDEEQKKSEIVSAYLNEKITSLYALCKIVLDQESLVLAYNSEEKDGRFSYVLYVNDGSSIDINNSIIEYDGPVPDISVGYDGDYYWMLNGDWIVWKNKKVPVVDTSLLPRITTYADAWSLSIGNSDEKLPIDPNPYESYSYISLEGLNDGVSLKMIFSSGHECLLPTAKGFDKLPDGVLEDSFYKDIFLDAGISLTSRKTLAAADYLGLSLEGISFTSTVDIDLQKAIMTGDSTDVNGRLLYPDGEPRYKAIFVVGGSARNHGYTLGATGLERIRQYVRLGGSYVGICAGAFLACDGYDNVWNYKHYLHLWPSVMLHTGLSKVYTGIRVGPDSPLLQYYDFGGDAFLSEVYHNGGGYVDEVPDGTEILARFDYPSVTSVHNQPAAWAYKENNEYGRLIMEGSHPEYSEGGENRDFVASLIQYAFDGRGTVSIKGFLRKGTPRFMDKSTEDNLPAYTKIGDLQTHHFAVYIPSEARGITITLDADDSFDMTLMLDRESYAFEGSAKYVDESIGGKKILSFPELDEGIWYIGVKCRTTVDVSEEEFCQSYSGRLDVLNGVPYSILVDWDNEG